MLKTSHAYTAFGLILDSELKLPELFSAEGQADIKIVWGNVPDRLEVPLDQSPWWEITANEYLLRVSGVASYYVKNGEEIIIEPCMNAKAQDIRVFLLGTVLPALLSQRDYLVLHGGAVVVNGKAVVFLGPSQVGKTALALCFYDLGHKLLGDEVCAIQMLNDKIVAQPGIPQLNAWQDTLVKTGRDFRSYVPIRTGLRKYAVPVCDRFASTGSELACVVFLNSHNQMTLNYQPIQGASKFKHLLQHACFNHAIVDRGRFFQMGSAVIQQASFYKAVFNNVTNPVEKLAGLILEELD